jgi:nesprin-1
MYVKFTEDMRLRFRVLERIRIKVESRDSQTAGDATSDVVTVEKLVYVQQRWTYTSNRTRVWLWKLDSSLPGRVGQIGDWLYRAEEKVGEVAAQDHSILAPAAAVDNIQQQMDEMKV